jgi:hypothetical protein
MLAGSFSFNYVKIQRENFLLILIDIAIICDNEILNLIASEIKEFGAQFCYYPSKIKQNIFFSIFTTNPKYGSCCFYIKFLVTILSYYKCQGCQIFVGTTYQKGKIKQKDHKIYRLAKKYTNWQ